MGRPTMLVSCSRTAMGEGPRKKEEVQHAPDGAPRQAGVGGDDVLPVAVQQQHPVGLPACAAAGQGNRHREACMRSWDQLLKTVSIARC